MKLPITFLALIHALACLVREYRIWAAARAGALFVPLALLAGSDHRAAELLRRAADQERQQSALRAQYLYVDHVELRTWNNNGSLGKVKSSWDYDVFYLEGAPYRRLTRLNGHPLTPAQEAAEVAKLKMTAAERRAAARQNARKTFAAGVRLDDVVRLLEHRLLREEVLGGRKAWVIESEAAKDATAEKASDANVLCYRYTHWIDQESLAVAQQDFAIVRSGADTEPGTTSRAIFASEGASPWFLRSLEGHFIVKRPSGIMRSHERHTCSSYRKFDAESVLTFDHEIKP